MIKSFYRYICFNIYKIAANSAKKTGEINKTNAYISFLLLIAFIPSVILGIKFGKLEFVIFIKELFPERSFLGIIIHLLLFFAPTMLLTSFLIKKSYLENLTLSDEEITKNKRIFWAIIVLLILYTIVKCNI
jgi:hypothetical protein